MNVNKEKDPTENIASKIAVEIQQWIKRHRQIERVREKDFMYIYIYIYHLTDTQYILCIRILYIRIGKMWLLPRLNDSWKVNNLCFVSSCGHTLNVWALFGILIWQNFTIFRIKPHICSQARGKTLCKRNAYEKLLFLRENFSKRNSVLNRKEMMLVGKWW